MPKTTFVPTRPPISQPSELYEYSNEHVFYEVDMFFNSILARKMKLQGSSEPLLHFLSMARIEAFVLHFRNLVTFLYPDYYRPKPDDVLAHHFFSGTAPWDTWLKARPLRSSTLEEGKARADKEMAHLTTMRIAGVQPQKTWDDIALGNEIRDCLNTLIEMADPNSLGPKVKAAIPIGPL